MEEELHTLYKYLQLHFDYIVLDKYNIMTLQFNTLERYSELLPEEIIDKEYFEYKISYLSDDSIRKESFKEDTAIYSDFDLTKGQIKININKKIMMNYFLQDNKNNLFYKNTNSFLDDIESAKHIVNQEEKVNLIILDNAYHENSFITINCLSNLINLKKILIKPNKTKLVTTANNIFDNIEVSTYFDLPHFWDFSSNDSVLFPIKLKTLEVFLKMIGNKLILKNEKEEIYLIKGHHNLEFNKLKDTRKLESITQIHSGVFCNIVDFVLDDKRHLDKLLITRNVATTYLNNNSSLADLNEYIEKMYSTIKHHFELYIQNEVKIFIDQKNQLLKETLEVTKQIAKNTSDLSSNTRTLISTFIVSVFVVLIPSVLKIKFNSELLYFFILSYVIFLLANLYLGTKIKKQHENSLINLQRYIQFSSVQSDTGLDYKNLYNSFLKKEESNFLSIYNFYKSILIFLLLTGITIIFSVS
ncbi:hypothetical protein [Sporosarcina ureae]|uniref:Uncharacterized protein n=1 Tax=Sporosarcina ureae TaxID=1571 RepID=A0ABN4YMM0_SPOUR|nr:hypothetical protein [Sporosarcina ureae]ARF12972.1 hypothetical protein SporoS204_01550 [Sporosarcina ureae]